MRHVAPPVVSPPVVLRLALFLALFVCSGCHGPDGEPPTGAPTDTLNATTIVRLPPLAQIPAPPLDVTLLYSTADKLELVSVSDAVVLADSTLVIADQGAAHLIRLDKEGAVIDRFGGAGDGPGEYTDIEAIGQSPDGGLFVFDGRAQRLTTYDADLALRTVQNMHFEGRYLPFRPVNHLGNATLSAVLEGSVPATPGVHRPFLHLVQVDSAGIVSDTLGRWPGKERYVNADGDRVAVGLARTAIYAGRNSYTLTGVSDSVDVTLYERAEPLVRLVAANEERRAPEDVREVWIDRFLQVLPEQVQSRWEERLEASIVNPTYPALRGVVVDNEGRIWLGEYESLDQQRRQWIALGPDGTPLGRLDLPIFKHQWLEHEISIPGEPIHELLDIGYGRLVLLRKNQFDVHYVEVYRFGGFSG